MNSRNMCKNDPYPSMNVTFFSMATQLIQASSILSSEEDWRRAV